MLATCTHSVPRLASCLRRAAPWQEHGLSDARCEFVEPCLLEPLALPMAQTTAAAMGLHHRLQHLRKKPAPGGTNENPPALPAKRLPPVQRAAHLASAPWPRTGSTNEVAPRSGELQMQQNLLPGGLASGYMWTLGLGSGRSRPYQKLSPTALPAIQP